MFSQSRDKKVDSSPIPPTTPTTIYSTIHRWVVVAVFLSTFVGWISFVYFVLAPSGASKDMRRKAEQQASLEAPKVLARILGEIEVLKSEVSLLRSAVEKLSGQS